MPNRESREDLCNELDGAVISLLVAVRERFMQLPHPQAERFASKIRAITDWVNGVVSEYSGEVLSARNHTREATDKMWGLLGAFYVGKPGHGEVKTRRPSRINERTMPMSGSGLWQVCARGLSFKNWANALSASNPALTPKDLGKILPSFYGKLGMNRKQLFEVCPVSRHVIERLIRRSVGEVCQDLEWNEKRTKLREWMLTIARANGKIPAPESLAPEKE